MKPNSSRDLPDLLRQKMMEQLPGRTGQSRFQPELSYGRQYGPSAHDTRQAAVIALLYCHDDQWFIPLTKRPAEMADHAGQISFPGGLVEKGESRQGAALRELEEELGITLTEANILGQLSSIYVFVSNFRVQPYVACVARRPVIVPNPIEVAKVLELPIDVLLNPRSHGHHSVSHGDLTFSAPHVEFAGERIWGATGMILGELAMLLEQVTQ